MFKRLLIPLDGSRMAETVLPVAAWLTERFAPEVVLIHVIEPHAPKEIHGERHLQAPEEAAAYLAEVQQQWFAAPAVVSTHVHSDDVAGITEGILMHAAEFDTDLIIMCTHGHSARQFIFGTVAQQVASRGDVPVFFVRARHGTPEKPFALGKLLVPLDGDPEHELGVNVAAEIAQALKATLHLVQVVQNLGDISGGWTQTARLLPHATSKYLDLLEDAAGQYLAGVQTRLKQGGLEVTTEVQRGEPADVIADIAMQRQSDLIVIGTHGKIGGEGFWSGSLTPRICERADTPMLLVPTSLVQHPDEPR